MNRQIASEHDSRVCPKCEGAGWYVRDGRRFVCPCQRDEARAIRRKYSGLPKFVRRPLTEASRDYVARFDEIARSELNWILYCGKTGTGKSTQAFGVVDALLERPKSIYVRCFNYPELARELSSLRYDTERYEDKIADALDPDLVVIDDFLDVVPKPESFEEQIALELIKRRYVQRKPMILTTELTPTLFRNLLPRHGEALFGRIYEMCDGRVSIAKSDAQNFRFAKKNLATC